MGVLDGMNMRSWDGGYIFALIVPPAITLTTGWAIRYVLAGR
jgi:hypothetical protein